MEVLQRLGAQAPAERGHEGSRACIWRCRPFKAHTHTRDWNSLRELVSREEKSGQGTKVGDNKSIPVIRISLVDSLP